MKEREREYYGRIMTETAPISTYEPIALEILKGGEAIFNKAEQVMMMREQWGKPFAALGNFFTQQENVLQGMFNESKLAFMDKRDVKEVLHFFGAKTIHDLSIESIEFTGTKNANLISTDEQSAVQNDHCYSISGNGRSAQYFAQSGFLVLKAIQNEAERKVFTRINEDPKNRNVADIRTMASGDNKSVETRRIAIGREKNGSILVSVCDDKLKDVPHPGIWGQHDESLKRLLAP